MDKDNKTIHIKIDIWDVVVEVNNKTFTYEPIGESCWLRVFSKTYPDIFLSEQHNNNFLKLLDEQLNDISNITLMIIEFNEHNVYYVDLRIIEHIMKLNSNYDILIKINYGYERYPISLPYEIERLIDNSIIIEQSWDPEWNFNIDKHDYRYDEYFNGLKYLLNKYNNYSRIDTHIYILLDHKAIWESENKHNVLNHIDINVKKIYKLLNCDNYQKYINYAKVTNHICCVDYEYMGLWSEID